MSGKDKSLLFAREYLVDLNATQAAIRAGYSKRSAQELGHQLLKRPHVQAEIQRLRAELVQRIDVTTDNTVKEIAKVAFASLRDCISIDADGQPRINLSATSKDTLDALAEVSTETIVESQGRDAAPLFVRKTKVKFHDKLGALDKLMRYLGAYETDNAQRGGSVEGFLKDIWARGGSRMPLAADDYDEDEAQDAPPAKPRGPVQ